MGYNIADVYITPKNVYYGSFDAGVYNFNLNRKSEKIEYEKKSYATNIKKKKVHELYFYRDYIRKSELKYMLYSNVYEDKEFEHVRILIYIKCRKNIDTFEIDNNYTLRYKGKKFHLNEKTKKYILNIMPEEMKNNWEYNLPRDYPADIFEYNNSKFYIKDRSNK